MAETICPTIHKMVVAERDKLKAINAVLLAALKDLVFQCRHSLREEVDNINLDDADAAIALAKKGVSHE